MRAKRGLCAVLASVFFVGATPSQPPLIDDIHARGPISSVGHGAFFDHEGQQIRLTPQFILDAQRYYLASLYQRADAAQKSRFSAFKRRLLDDRAIASTPLEQVFIDGALTSWLIDQVQPARAGLLASISSALRWEYSNLVGKTFTPPARMLEALKQEKPGGVTIQRSTGTSGTAYIDACRAAGVPIPPDWGTSGWRPRGALQSVFISQGSLAEVYTFESTSPRGICFALPRSNGNSIGLLGIICQGNDTGNACFWDNQVNDVNVAIPKGTVKPLTQFAGGYELFGGGGGRCTACHTGENAFVVHPNSPLNLGPSLLMPSQWYKPMVHPDWPANPGPENFLASVPAPANGSCLQCHSSAALGGRFPQISTDFAPEEYRNAVLSPAMSKTMPPAKPGDPNYQAHRTALLNACNRTPAQVGLDVVGGNTIAVWRPSNGTWFVKNHVTGATRTQQWGTAGDVPVPADYDGDGTTDFAVWRPSSGTWFVIESRTGASWSRQWGAPGDVPLPFNYRNTPAEGVELTVWRPSSGTWFILNRVTNDVLTRQWGVSGDVPVRGRFETVPIPILNFTIRVPVPSLTVWRPSSGVWFVQNVGNAATASRQWGISSDIPVPADYNSDGRTDIAVWRPSEGNWYILNSTSIGATSATTFFTRKWGTAGDVPVPGDYDRDGKIDIAVWRPSEGNWYIIRSTDGAVKVHQWGTRGDIPVHYTVAPGI